nr:methyltransferase domain-containing protein [Desulfobulbaceae bacterium]
MRQPEVIIPTYGNNLFYKYSGALILIANKLKHEIEGYKTPRTFPIKQFGRAADYDIKVVKHWLEWLSFYANKKTNLSGKQVLELGPGADLGVGLYLLFIGADRYNAIDIHNLVNTVPDGLYSELFKKIRSLALAEDVVDINFLREQLAKTKAGTPDKLNYVHSAKFDFSTFQEHSIDLVVSQAAFEHFEDMDQTFHDLERIVKSGSQLVSVIDLKTHTRWIRDKDPLNIYRYNDFFYNLCRFKGSPNRLRPRDYKNIATRYGWKDIVIYPELVLDKDYVKYVKNSLSTQFNNDSSQMEYLSVVLCATKR